MKWLRKAMEFATGHRRNRVEAGTDFEWDSRSWVHCLFRCWELAAGRRQGQRLEMTAGFNSEGFLEYNPRTWEAWFALREQYIRQFFRDLSYVRVTVPVLVTPTGQRLFASPYVFNIAFDNKKGQQGNPIGNISFTVSGSNRLLVNGIRSLSSGTTTTYNGSSMTRIGSAFNVGGGDWDHFWYLLAPSTGTNDVAYGTLGAGSTFGAVASYTGVLQSGQPDANNSANGNSQTIAVSVTTVADGCFIIAWADNEQTNLVGDANTTVLQVPGSTAMGLVVYASNPKTPAGAQSIGCSLDTTALWYINAASFSPDSFSPPTSIKTVDGLAKASVKTVDGLAIASVKTIDGLS